MDSDEFKSARKGFGFTQSDIAPLFATGLQTISEWERGVRPVEPRAALLMRAYIDGYRPARWPAGVGSGVAVKDCLTTDGP